MWYLLSNKFSNIFSSYLNGFLFDKHTWPRSIYLIFLMNLLNPALHLNTAGRDSSRSCDPAQE